MSAAGPLPTVHWPTLADSVRDAGAIAERIINASDADLPAACRHKTAAAVFNAFADALDNLGATAALIRLAEARILAAATAETSTGRDA